MKTVLITGSSRGIGAQTAKLFAKNGYNVIVNCKTSYKSAQKVVDSIKNQGHSAELKIADVADEDQVKQMVDEVIKKYKKIDVLINNAGIALYKLLSETTTEEWQEVFDVNMKGTFFCTKYALNNMLKNKYGKIINISSVWGQVGACMEVAYSASKGAMIAFTKALAKEVGKSNINVNCICPGVINTAMNDELTKQDIKDIKDKTPLNKIGNTADVAELALYLADDKSAFMTGQIITIDGGFVS